MKIKVGIADDHLLFLKSLSQLIDSFPDFQVVVDAMNGEALLTQLNKMPDLPDIILLDVDMPVFDGKDTAKIISETYPLIKMIALSMKDDDTSVINMILNGCSAYLLKEIHPSELERALLAVHNTGYYNTDVSAGRLRKIIMNRNSGDDVKLSTKEKVFLQLACSDLTYKEIALRMSLSERTIDGYREGLFEKLNVQSRVGMVLEALRRQYVKL
ncbi:MAG: response regulator transcription factor [Chitinophagaceae bacterium]|nr:MAG: response regulator transcription factor [Chitinophagaceae bacterium]